MTFVETQSAYQAALSAESVAQTALDAAIEARAAILLQASRESAPADDKRIVSATTAVVTAQTAADMAGLKRADAERTMHLAEIDELTQQAAALVADHESAVQNAKAAAAHAREALQAAQDAVAAWRGALQTVSQTGREGAQHDIFIAARAASNPLLAAIPSPERPKTRLQTAGSGSAPAFDVGLIGPAGARVGLHVFN
jgi:hypothetical protein